jgi:hypothetical protein
MTWIFEPILFLHYRLFDRRTTPILTAVKVFAALFLKSAPPEARSLLTDKSKFERKSRKGRKV